MLSRGGEATTGYMPHIVSLPPLIVLSAAQSPRVTSSDPTPLVHPLVLCCAGWLLPVVLPLLLVSLPSLHPR
jgi:hypothetical protein